MGESHIILFLQILLQIFVIYLEVHEEGWAAVRMGKGGRIRVLNWPQSIWDGLDLKL